MSNNKRLKPAIRKEQIIAAALKLAEDYHYREVTRNAIAARMGVVGSAVQYHIGTMQKLRGEMMRAAIKQRRLTVIAQGIMMRDPRTRDLDRGLRAEALAHVGVS